MGAKKDRGRNLPRFFTQRKAVMASKLNFYTIDPCYYEFLRSFESRLMLAKDGKERRPFIGIVLNVNGVKYCAPLSSPKQKHLTMKNSLDFHKIENGIYGAINFNNMFPVYDDVLRKIETQKFSLQTKEDFQYKNLLDNQLTWCNLNREIILKKAEKLYRQLKISQNASLVARCCDFCLLEQKMKEYIKK